MITPMLQGVVRGGLITAGLLAVGVSGLAFRRPAAMPVTRPQSAIWQDTRDSLAPSARAGILGAVVAHDAFRRNRLAPAKPYDGVQIEAARLAPPAPPAPKPLLVLTGILWGAMPAALIDGVPGNDGSRLFHPGDTAGGIRLRSLTRDHVVLVGMDTTWSLIIRRPAP